MIPLNEGDLEKSYLFVGFLGEDEARESAEKHLQNLGLVRGTDVKIMSRNKDNLIVMIHDSRIALDPEMSKSIVISEVAVNPDTASITLSELGVGNYSRIIGVLGKGAVKRRLMDMGLTKGIDVFVRKVAPLGDPVEINVRGYELTLRKNEADLVLVEAIERGEA